MRRSFLVPSIAVSLLLHAVAFMLSGPMAGAASSDSEPVRHARDSARLPFSVRLEGGKHIPLPPEPTDAQKQPALRSKPPAPIPVAPPDYIDARELTEKPEPENEVSLDYPHVAIARDGVVRLTLFISETGKVDRVEVEESTLPDAYQKAAQATFAQARFTPGRLDGKSAKSKLHIEVRYDSGTVGPALR
jgi:TonB family protein